MAVTRNSRVRRAEVRKSLRDQQPTWQQRLGQRQVVLGLLYMIVFVVLASIMVLDARSEPQYRVGQLVDRTPVARVPFESVDLEATEQGRKLAAMVTDARYRLNNRAFDELRTRLVALPETVAHADSVEDVREDVAGDFALTDQTVRLLKAHQRDGAPLAGWVRAVDRFISELQSQPILHSEDFQLEKQTPANAIVLIGSGQRIADFRLISLADKEEISRVLEQAAQHFAEPEIRSSVVAYAWQRNEPTVIRDEQATSAAKAEAAESFEPIRVHYRAGQELIPAGTRLGEEGYKLLQDEQHAYMASLGGMEWWLARGGPVMLVVMISLGLIGAIIALHPRVAQNPWRGLALAILLLATVGLATVVRSLRPDTTAAAAVGAAMLTAVIIVIAYDQFFSLVLAALHTVLIALALDLSLGLFTVSLAATIVAVAQMREIRHRGTLVRVGLVSGIVAAVGVWAAGLTEMNHVPGLYGELAAASTGGFVSALGVGFFVLGVLPFIERSFKVTTSMTLLELCDVNQPLLRRLAQVAPGTYNHSLTLASMAEAAAEAIGANGLACRVGAYYHDIGKINKPRYFIENQGGGPNKHDKLSPAMSLLIIVGHVKDGVEMAREFGLPRVIQHFIESHHGTTLVEYFYHAARQRQGDDDQPSEMEFRYPGPKPQTREAAILLLCDSVEAAMRSMAEPTAGRIEQFVHQMAMKRLMDGQFDRCNLTLEELHRIEQAITKTLCGIYHGRIAYPSASKSESEKSDADLDKDRRSLAAG